MVKSPNSLQLYIVDLLDYLPVQFLTTSLPAKCPNKHIFKIINQIDGIENLCHYVMSLLSRISKNHHNVF